MPKLTVPILLMLFFHTRPPLSIFKPRPELSALAREGNVHLRAGRMAEAEPFFRDGLNRARQKANWTYVSGFLTSLGVVRIHQGRYRQALDYFIQSQDAAHQTGSATEAGWAAFNIGVIYVRLGDWHRGRAAMLEAVRDMKPDRQPTALAVNLGDYESWLKNYDAADRYFRRSVENSERLALNSEVAASWERWGLSYLDRSELNAAEHCLLESYRIRRLAKRPEAEQVHYGLARLALANGDLPEARRRAAQYLRAARQNPLLYPLWEAYRLAGEIEEQSAQLSKAYGYYTDGVEWARQSRAERLPSAQLMATAESALQNLYLSLIRVAQALHRQQPDPALLLSALEAGEDGRSAAQAENSALLADDYWQTLDQLQRTQARRLSDDTPELALETESLRTALLKFESAAGLRSSTRDSHRQSIAQARQNLAADEAAFIFRTGEPASYAWLVSRDDIQLRALRSAKQLSADIQEFRADVIGGRALESRAGKRLFSELFGAFDPAASTRRRWTLIPDGPLHELPFAALPWPSDHPSGSLVVEHQTLLLAPSMATLAIELKHVALGPSFAGVADPIYNSADPRLVPVPQRNEFGWFRRSVSASDAFELTRLPGSQTELDVALKVLRPEHPVLLTGRQVTRRAFLDLLDQRADTLHLATHVIPTPDDPRHALIALGLNPQTREQELVGADEINARRHSARLVVMSGCGSGRGEALPGAGLMGLTRAWLLSGATGVVASHWPVPDHSGALFERFYRHAQSARRPGAADWALALQQAQVESIHDHIPASVWAAYFLTGRN